MEDRFSHYLFRYFDSLRGLRAHEQIEWFREKVRGGELSISTSEIWSVAEVLSKLDPYAFSPYFVPEVVIEFVEAYLDGFAAQKILDPSAGLGVLISAAQSVTRPVQAVAIESNSECVSLGGALNPSLEWRLGASIDRLESLPEIFDVVVGCLPLGIKVPDGVSGQSISQSSTRSAWDDLGHTLLALGSQKLDESGVGIFVTTSSFFWSRNSPFRRLSDLGVGVEAALEMPAGAFAPITKTPTYLIVTRRGASRRIFVGKLDIVRSSNVHLISNLKTGVEGETLEQGQFVDADTFTGLSAVRIDRQFEESRRLFGAPSFFLNELALQIRRGRPGDDFEFIDSGNSIYIPTVGSTDVADSVNNLILKVQNYVQLDIDPAKSDSRFVARFLNSELGKSLREASKVGSTIGHITNESLKTLRVFVPSLELQQRVLEVESLIAIEQKKVLGLQNQLADFGRTLWTNPRRSGRVKQEVNAFASRLSADFDEETAAGIERWIQGLPYPVASILATWSAISEFDLEKKYLCLLHFFEATAEFLSIVLLSAFTSRPSIYETCREEFLAATQGKILTHPDFGTWISILGYLAKRTRAQLSDGQQGRDLCREVFADPSNQLPEMLSSKAVLQVLQRTNEFRNDWKGHTGLPTPRDAEVRHVQLLGELHELRHAMADGWANVELVQARNCFARRNHSTNEVSILMGSHTPFRAASRNMDHCLELDCLHLKGSNSRRALRMLPLIQLGPNPSDTRSACYFFNRVEDGGRHRMVSYQFADQSELFDGFEGINDALSIIANGTSGF